MRFLSPQPTYSDLSLSLPATRHPIALPLVRLQFRHRDQTCYRVQRRLPLRQMLEHECIDPTHPDEEQAEVRARIPVSSF